MKIKSFTICVLAIVPLFVTGCFTAMRQSAEGWNGSSTTSEKVTTTVLDVVTLPVSGPYFITHSGYYSPVSKEQAEEVNHLMSLLENDPGIALKERWDLVLVDSRPQGKMKAKPGDSRQRAFIASFLFC